MNVLFVHERAAFMGGVEQNIADSVDGLRARSIRCHLAYSPRYESQSEFAALFDTVRTCSDLEAIGCGPGSTLTNIVKDTAADCVYLHKLPKLPNLESLAGVRVVQMVHDHDLCCPRRHKYFVHNSTVCSKPAGWRCYLDGAFLSRRHSNGLGIRFESIGDKILEMRKRQAADSFLVASKFMRDELLMNAFPADRITVLPLAVRHAPLLREVEPSGIPTVLYVGQLIKGKGVDLLLRAITKVNAAVRVLIVGKGNAEHSLRVLSERLGLSNRVAFLGWVDNRKLPELYAQADVVAVPSRWPEPFGMVGLEAMWHSRAVVAFDVGGIRDWLQNGETGLLVPAADVEGLAQSLERLLVDRGLAHTMGRNGFLRVNRCFHYEQYISGLQAVLLPRAPVSSSEPVETCA